MKTKTLSNKCRPANINVSYNSELNQCNPQTLFPEKLAKAKEVLKKHPIPKELLKR